MQLLLIVALLFAPAVAVFAVQNAETEVGGAAGRGKARRLMQFAR